MNFNTVYAVRSGNKVSSAEKQNSDHPVVAAVGKKPISGMVLDASYYPSNLRIPGIEDTGEAYNALNSASLGDC